MGVCISQTSSSPPPTGTVNKSHFAFKYAVGKGTYGFVWKAEKKPSNFPYAIKVMSKARVFNMRSADTINNEMKLLS